MQHAFHCNWEVIGYGANTIVFVYSGIVVAKSLANDHIGTWRHFGNAILLYVVLHVVRGTVILVLQVCTTVCLSQLMFARLNYCLPSTTVCLSQLLFALN